MEITTDPSPTAEATRFTDPARAAIAVVGGAAALKLGASLDHIFMAVSLGMTSFGLLSLPGLFHRSAYGTR